MNLKDATKVVTSAVQKVAGDRQIRPGRLDVSRPGSAGFGDFTTNAAMVLAGELKKSPRELAEELAEILRHSDGGFTKVLVAGPGFINMWVSDEAVVNAAGAATKKHPDNFYGQTVVVEFSDPNPFKVLHVGHIYTSVVGDAVSRLLQRAGAKVHRVNFGGDVGRHVATNLWAMRRELDGERPEKLEKVPPAERGAFMARCYVSGAEAFKSDEAVRDEVAQLNKRIYGIVNSADHDSPLAQIYWKCREWSYQYFAEFYKRIGIEFERYYPESETAPLGLKTVQEELKKGVYKESDGAVVFEGEPYGLHTRVFINSQGLPTYEAKDVGLIEAKWNDYHFDRSVVITGNDIVEYMKVVLKSIEQFQPKLAERSTHLTHGNVKLSGGVKMSSRLGNAPGAVEVLDMVAEANRRANGKDNEAVVIGAVKYAFLKQRLGPDVIFVPEESVSLEGNSGPYLQYAYARAKSILRKAGVVDGKQTVTTVEEDERLLARMIAQYPDVVQTSVDELMPHHVAAYLYQLAQAFNRFYERNRVIGDTRQAVRVHLVGAYAQVLGDGLGLLGIEAPEQL